MSIKSVLACISTLSTATMARMQLCLLSRTTDVSVTRSPGQYSNNINRLETSRCFIRLSNTWATIGLNGDSEGCKSRLRIGTDQGYNDTIFNLTSHIVQPSYRIIHSIPEDPLVLLHTVNIPRALPGIFLQELSNFGQFFWFQLHLSRIQNLQSVLYVSAADEWRQ